MEGDVHRVRLHAQETPDLAGSQVGAIAERDELSVSRVERRDSPSDAQATLGIPLEVAESVKAFVELRRRGAIS
jgi:hypothetical protein